MTVSPESQNAFEQFLEASRKFWHRNKSIVPPNGRRILVDLYHFDTRQQLRALWIAKAVQNAWGGEALGLGHADEDWQELLARYDPRVTQQIAEASGVAWLDVRARLAENDLVLSADHRHALARLCDGDFDDPREVTLRDGFPVGRHVLSTWQRLARNPYHDRATSKDPLFRSISGHAMQLHCLYTELLRTQDVTCAVVSHVDYTIWGILAECCIRHGVPVLHFQATQNFKIFNHWPEKFDLRHPFRQNFTRWGGQQFRQDILPLADIWAPSIERTVHLNRMDLTRPPWWLTGSVFLYDRQDLKTVRSIALQYLGWQDTAPVYCLFLHSLTDALWNNAEVFDGYLEWIRETLTFARANPGINWLVRDHPAADTYDQTGTFATLAEEFRAPNIVFSRAKTFDKNLLWSVCDLAITVRGSVGNELPAYGIPVVQAGHSEMSECGFSRVATSRAEYFELLSNGLPAPTSEAVIAARLWMFYYRTLSSLPSTIVPGLNIGSGDRLFTTLRENLKIYNIDDDPLFVAIARMLQRRDPLLMQHDMIDAAREHGSARNVQPYRVEEPIRSWFDIPKPSHDPGPLLRMACLDDILIASGFSQAYDWGRWTVGDISMLALQKTVAEGKGLLITLRGRANVVTSQRQAELAEVMPDRALTELCVTVQVNGVDLSDLMFDGDGMGALSRPYSFFIPEELVRGRDVMLVVLNIPVGRRTPLSTGTGPDTRRLGLALADLAFHEVDPAPTPIGTWIDFATLPQTSAVQGMDRPENWGRWTLGRHVSWLIPLPVTEATATDHILTLLTRAFVFRDSPAAQMDVRVFANGIPLGSLHFDAACEGDVPRRYAILIPVDVMAARPILQIALQIETGGQSPMSLGRSKTDKRRLGLALGKFRLDATQDAEKPSYQA